MDARRSGWGEGARSAIVARRARVTAALGESSAVTHHTGSSEASVFVVLGESLAASERSACLFYSAIAGISMQKHVNPLQLIPRMRIALAAPPFTPKLRPAGAKPVSGLPYTAALLAAWRRAAPSWWWALLARARPPSATPCTSSSLRSDGTCGPTRPSRVARPITHAHARARRDVGMINLDPANDALPCVAGARCCCCGCGADLMLYVRVCVRA